MNIARKLRTWFPGAVYHIMHRGVRRKAIFQEEMDYQVLLQVLKNSLEKYKCILHAYCLMTNHIHLLLETGDMEIWKFMKYMSECYAMYLNHKYSYRGHVFESRYKSCLVKEDAYFFLWKRISFFSPPQPVHPFKSGKSTDDKLSGRLSMEQLSDNDWAFR